MDRRDNNSKSGANGAIGKILVVDDEPELEAALVEALSAQGYEATGYSSGHDALQALQGENFDLLLTDLMMPEMDGIALLQAALEVDPNLVPLMMTGQGTIQTAVDAMKVGAFDYVLKPFRLVTILPVLTRAMNARHLRLENLKLRETVAIHELSQTIAFTLDPQTVLSKLADAALQQSEADEVSVLLPTADGTELYVAAVRGEKRERLLGERIPFDQSISSWVARELTPVILNGEVDDERFVALWPRQDICSSVSVPMQVANKLIGVLNLNVVNRPRRFTLGQIKGLTILAGTAAAAIESGSLYTQVRKAEETYRSIFENAVEGIYQTTTDGRFITANPAMAQMLGYDSPEELIAAMTDVQFDLYLDPKRRSEFKRLVEENGRVSGFELEHKRKDGSLAWLSESSRAVRDESGAMLYYEGIVHDLTDRKRTEEKVRESETRYRSLFENMLEGFAYCQMLFENDQPQDFIYLEVNSAFEELTGLKNVVGKKVSEVIPGIRETSPELFEIYGRVALTGKPERFEIYVETLGIWFSISAYGTEKGYFIAVFDNITERKRAEAERRLIFDIIQGVITTPNLDELLRLIHSSISKLLYAENCFVGLHDQKTNSMHFEYWVDKFDPVPPPHPPGKGFASYVLRTNQPLLLTKEFKDRMYRSGEVVKSGRSSASWLGVPLRTPSRAVGVLVVQHYEDEDAYSQRDLELLSSVGDQIALAIERKRAEDEQARLTAILQATTDMVATADLNGFVQYINHAGLKMLGLSEDDNISNTRIPEYHPEWAASIVTNVGIPAAIKNGSWSGETAFLTRDGREVPVSQVIIAHKASDGTIEYLSTIARDITERKRTEEKMRESEERYRDLVESSSEMILTHDLDGVILSANRAAEAVFGDLPEGYLGKWNLRDLLVPEVRDQFDDYLTRIRRDGMASGLMLIQTSSGERRVLEYHNTLRTEGVVTPIVRGMARDITERAQVEARVRNEQSFSESIINSLPGIFYVFNQAGKFLRWNKNFETVTGYSVAEIATLHPIDLFVGEEKELIAKRIQEVFTSGVSDAEAHLVSQSGQRTPYYFTGVRIDVNQEPCLIGVGLDISERRQVEEALRASEEQLRQSQKMEAIGQLAGGVAHDFNNLLTVIGGYAELLLRRLPQESPFHTSAEEIKKASDRAGGLTRQLLAFSRKQILQPKVLDLNTVVSDLDKMLRRLIGEDIDLLVISEPGLGHVKADPGQIEQVILNLAVNARDAMPNGGQFTIRTSNVYLSEDYARHHVAAVVGNYVMLAISDNGCGMQMDTRERIFEPFFTTKGAGKGTGLGLSTVYGIVRQSGGNIWVYSEVGKGTTFKIYLPRVDEPRDGDIGHAALTPVAHGTETILLVEDEEQVREIVHEILTSQGYNVLLATNGEQALALAQQYEGEIHLMITDVVMPQMGGRESVERLAPLRPNMKVVYMSGYTDDAIVRHGLIDEQLQFIEKPFTADAMARKVRKVLDSGAVA